MLIRFFSVAITLLLLLIPRGHLWANLLDLPPKYYNTFETGTTHGIGLIEDSSLVGNRLFLGTSIGLIIFDVSNPEKILRLGTLPFVNGVSRIVVNGDIVYLTSGNRGIFIVDVSSLNNPRIISVHNPERRKTTSSTDDQNRVISMGLAGRYLVAGVYNNGIEVIDVGIPEKPVIVSKHEGYEEYEQMKVFGSYLYAYNAVRGRLEVFDFQDPTNLKKLNEIKLDVGRGRCSIWCDDNYLAINVRGNLFLYNIKDPVRPEKLSMTKINDWFYSLAFSHNRFFVFLKSNRVGVIDAVNMAEPETFELKADKNPTWTIPLIRWIHLLGDYLYIVGCRTFSVYKMTGPSEIKFKHLFGGLKADGNYILDGKKLYYEYKTNQQDIWIDILELNREGKLGEKMGKIHLKGNRFTWKIDMRIWRNYLYVSVYNQIHVFDLRNISSPILVNRLKIGKRINDIEIWEGTLVVASDKLLTFDLSDPVHPVQQGNYEVFTSDITLSGKRAYITKGENDILILDISNLSKPSLVARLQTEEGEPHKVRAVIAQEDLLFALTSREILVFNVKDPKHPRKVYKYAAGYFYDAKNFVLHGEYIYALATRGVFALKIEEGGKLVLVGVLPSNSIYGLYHLWDDKFIIDTNGFQILQFRKD